MITLMISLLLIMAIMFAFFVVFFKKVVSKDVSSATAHLDSLTKEYLRKQAELDKKLEEVEQLSQLKINKANEEAEKLRSDILNEANAQKDRILQEARRESEEIIKQAEKARHNLIRDMEKRIELKAWEKAVDLIGEILPLKIRENIHHQLIEDFIKNGLVNFPEIKEKETVKEVICETGFPLKEEERELIQQGVRKGLGKEYEWKEVMQESLIAGIVLKIGSVVMDVSLKWQARKSAQKLMKKETP